MSPAISKPIHVLKTFPHTTPFLPHPSPHPFTLIHCCFTSTTTNWKRGGWWWVVRWVSTTAATSLTSPTTESWQVFITLKKKIEKITRRRRLFSDLHCQVDIHINSTTSITNITTLRPRKRKNNHQLLQNMTLLTWVWFWSRGDYGNEQRTFSDMYRCRRRRRVHPQSCTWCSKVAGVHTLFAV